MKIPISMLSLVACAIAVQAQTPARAPGAALPPPGGSIVGPEGNPLNNRRSGPSGPAPKMDNGMPDLSGVWFSPRTTDPGKPMMLPWADALTKQRNPKDDPEAHCLPAGVPRMNPFPWKIIQTDKLLVMLFEGNIHSYRQVFLDRGHSKDLEPTWYGESIGTWEGDTLVVDTVGFNDKFWFDFAGHPHTEQLHVIERYHRLDLGNLDIDITIIDPGAYTEPWKIKRTSVLMNGEIQEYICNENNQDVEHLVGR
jgi:hypothetical protein